MIIQHNIAAMNAHRQLGANTINTNKSIEKLSSGFRINRAGDDAAGLAISEKMRGQIRGLDQASRNAQDGISLIQTAEGALNETHSILQKMRELAVQAANDTNVNVDRGEIQKELNQLTSEINRIGNTTEFNTQKLLDGTKSWTAPTAAVMTGTSALNNVTTIRSVATAATATSSAIIGNIRIHNAEGAYVEGNGGVDFSTNFLDLTPGNNNELSFRIDGEQFTLAVAAADYSGAGTGTAGFTAAFSAAFGAGLIGSDGTTLLATDLTLTTNAAGEFNLQLTGAAYLGAGHTFEIMGSGLADEMFGAGTPNWNQPGDVAYITKGAGLDANNAFSIGLDGGPISPITLNTGTYTIADLATMMNAELDNDIGSNLVDVSVVNGNQLKLTRIAPGTLGSIDSFANAANTTTLESIGFMAATIVDGQDVNNTLNFIIDGENALLGGRTITLDDGDYSKVGFADMLQTKINAATNTAADVSVDVNADNELVVTSGSTGTLTSSIDFNPFSSAFATTGLPAGPVAGSDGSATDMKLQIGANSAQSMSVSINDMRSAGLKVSTLNANAATNITASNGQIASFASLVGGLGTVSDGTQNINTEVGLDVSDHSKATAAISVLQDAIESVSAERSKLGAYQNRLEHTINNLGTSSENLTAAESRIRDVDMAKEMMSMTKNNILAQAAQAMLAQANQQPQGVLQLLR